MIQVIFSKIEPEISPFLTVRQFCSNINEKRVGKSSQEISMRPTCRNILTNLKGQDKIKMELPLVMVSKHAFCTSSCRTTTNFPNFQESRVELIRGAPELEQMNWSNIFGTLLLPRLYKMDCQTIGGQLLALPPPWLCP